MKITKVTLIALISAMIAAITVPVDSFAKGTSRRPRQQTIAAFKDVVAPETTPEVQTDEVVVDQKEVITRATAETEIITQSAMGEMDKARQQLIEGEITPAQAIKIISEQNYIIAQAKQELKKTIAQSVEKVEESDAQQSYVNYFMSGAQSLGERALAPFKAGYGYTKEEKEIAAQAIKGLMKQKEQLTTDYEQARKTMSDSIKRVDLKKRYDAIISQIDNEIYQQQLITGEVMSTKRKLFWGAVVAGGAVAGLATLGSGASTVIPGAETSSAPQPETVTVDASAQPPIIDTLPDKVPTPVLDIPATPEMVSQGFEEATIPVVTQGEVAPAPVELVQEPVIETVGVPEQTPVVDIMPETVPTPVSDESVIPEPVEQEGVFPWLKRVFSEKVEARKEKQLEKQLEKQEELAAANALAQAKAIEEAEQFNEPLALQRELQAVSDIKAGESIAEGIRRAEEIERENLPFEQLRGREARAEYKSAIDDALTVQKGQREDLEMAKIREMEAGMAEEGRVDEKLMPQQRSFLEPLEDIKGPEQWKESKYAALEQQREYQALANEIANLEQTLASDEEKLVAVMAKELERKEESTLSSIWSWATGEKQTLPALEWDRKELVEEIKTNERVMEDKKEQLAQLETEMSAMPVTAWAGGKALEFDQKVKGIKAYFKPQEETSTQKIEREMKEAAKRKAAETQLTEAQKQAQEAARRAKEKADEQARRAEENAEKQAKLIGQRQEAALERGEARNKARKEFEEQKKKEERTRAQEEAKRSIAEAQEQEKKRQAEAQEEARIAKEEADRKKEEQQKQREARAAEVRRIANLKDQERKILAERIVEVNKGPNMNFENFEKLEKDLTEVQQQLGRTPQQPAPEDLFGDIF